MRGRLIGRCCWGRRHNSRWAPALVVPLRGLALARDVRPGIENVVASATVDQKMDLNDITKKFPDVEYHPDQFPGLVFRLKSPKTA